MKFLKSLMLILACLLAQPMFGVVTLDHPTAAVATVAHVDQNYSPGVATVVADVSPSWAPAVILESNYFYLDSSQAAAANIINGDRALSQGTVTGPAGFKYESTIAGLILAAILTSSLIYSFTARHAKARLHRLIRAAARSLQAIYLSVKAKTERAFTLHPKYSVYTHTPRFTLSA